MSSNTIRSQQRHSARSVLNYLSPSPRSVRRILALLGLSFLSQLCALHAQTGATAVQQLQISAFGAGTGTWTNLAGGHNLSVTAGGDVAFLTFRRLRPVIEVRGTYPVHGGTVDSQKDVLGGLRVEREIGVFRPYVNFLVGRGAIDFQDGGFRNGPFIYLRTISTVYSPGLGVEYDVSHHWSAMADFQYQHWDTAAVSSGMINPRVLSVGAVYRFDFNHHYKEPKARRR